jgi:NAD(P)-dependent dehydrogenase (short-subunit alcohol dehydrogenase family)
MFKSTGMGYTLAEHLALHGAKVWMGARSKSKAKEVIQTYQRICAETTNKGSIVWLPLDLTTPRDVAKFAELFLSPEERLDIPGKYPMSLRRVTVTAIKVLKYIVNNAGRNASVAIK